MYFGHRRTLDKTVNDLVQLVEDVSPCQVDIPPVHGQMRQVQGAGVLKLGQNPESKDFIILVIYIKYIIRVQLLKHSG